MERLAPSGVVAFDTSELTDWDSGLLTVLSLLIESCDRRQLTVDRSGLPSGVARLLALVEAVPEKADARSSAVEIPFINRVGEVYLAAHYSISEMFAFLGSVTLVCRYPRAGNPIDQEGTWRETGPRVFPLQTSPQLGRDCLTDRFSAVAWHLPATG